MPDWLPYLDIPVPAAEADVRRAISLAGRAVPDDVVGLLTAHQGQAPEPSVVPLGDDGSAAFGPVLVVSPTIPNTSNHTYSVAFAIAALNDWMPPTDGKPAFFPFASDTASGWYCVDQRDPARRIVFIDMTYGPDETGAITPVAGDVANLLAKLRS